MKRPDSSLVALTVGALGSAAANTAWTWSAGPVRIVAGLFTTALVPVAMHLWPQVPITGGWTRFLRGLVMTYICGAAAVVNLAHAVLLLTDERNERAEHLVLAVLSITAVEALMVMASLARRTPASAVSPPAVLQDAPTVSESDAQDVAAPVRQDAGQDAPRSSDSEVRAVVLPRPIETSYAPATAVLPRPVEASCAGQDQDATQDTRQDARSDSGQDEASDDRQDAAETAGQDAQDDVPNTETDPVRWAVIELRAGRSAGYVVLRRQFPDLSERDAKKVARKAREEQDAGLHVVRTGT